MKKRLSAHQALYFLLVNILVGMFLSFLLAIFIGTGLITASAPNFIIHKIISNSISSLIFIIVAFTSTDFRKMVLFKIIYFILLIIEVLLSPLELNSMIYTLLIVIIILINIPAVYYFYNGFIALTDGESLKRKWKIIHIINLAFAVYKLIEFVIMQLSVGQNLNIQNIMYIMSFVPGVLAIVDFIYILKTVNLIKTGVPR